MSEKKYDIGIAGLGVMGRNLAMNIADHGFSVAGFDIDPAKVTEFEKKGNGRTKAAASAGEFASLLRRPQAFIMLVPAGKAVDSAINGIFPHLEHGAIIIDGGNSYYKDTDTRMKALAAKGMHFIGMGVSGGEEGARRGPSLMPGGNAEAYKQVRPILEAAAAKVEGEPCITYLGPGASGHYVKMVHNGIEYGLMELIAETYDLMKRYAGMNNDDLHKVYEAWSHGRAGSFLLEITAEIFLKNDEKTGSRLIDMILDRAAQNGTGKWTSQDAMDLQVSVPTIDAAVMMRALSGNKKEREEAAGILKGPEPLFEGERQSFIQQIGNSLYFSMITAYAQGMALLRAASAAYGYGISLKEVARIWRGGCIIRAELLDEIAKEYGIKPGLNNLMMAPHMASVLSDMEHDLRHVISRSVESGIPVPGLMSSLAYFDAWRSRRLPANLIQAQRDYFGAHTYERTDGNGTFHTVWEKN
ncbi:MAG: NADP-dependent phosphogluconate dehydrogenase [Deltaproteobacteria bacterium]|nr:NADP-dependent phosphogluconate dehydrogenase [Deltaproteobacteria bacterium]MCL5878373.1 NADP-dependent phosphogluconate dehydrogenase [Deltaproteobacteria bacterium]